VEEGLSFALLDETYDDSEELERGLLAVSLVRSLLVESFRVLLSEY
jgi:hypothetical protein